MCAWFYWAGQPIATLQNFRRVDWLHLPLNQIGVEAGLDHPKATIQLEEKGFPGSLSAEEITRASNPSRCPASSSAPGT
jgi:hypothetical protein